MCQPTGPSQRGQPQGQTLEDGCRDECRGEEKSKARQGLAENTAQNEDTGDQQQTAEDDDERAGDCLDGQYSIGQDSAFDSWLKLGAVAGA